MSPARLIAFATMLALLGFSQLDGAQADDNREVLFPSEISEHLWTLYEESDWPTCERAQARMTIEYLLETGSDQLFGLLGIPDYLCGSNSFLPVKSDSRGVWHRGEQIIGNPGVFLKMPEEAWLLSSQWAIEGTFPTLIHSADGVTWNEVPLPDYGDMDCCFIYLSKLCVTDEQQVFVTIEADADAPQLSKTWFASYPEIVSADPTWIQSDGLETHGVQCSAEATLTDEPTAAETLKDTIRYDVDLNGNTISIRLPR